MKRMSTYTAPVRKIKGSQVAMKIQKFGEITSFLVSVSNRKKFIPNRVYEVVREPECHII